MNESKGLSAEQELILTVKKELNKFRKDLINLIFLDSKSNTDNLLKAGGQLDVQLIKIEERLADYCDNSLISCKADLTSPKSKLPQKQSAQYTQAMPTFMKIECTAKNPSKPPAPNLPVKVLRNEK
jgi:uncharacterized protein with PIN domain